MGSQGSLAEKPNPLAMALPEVPESDGSEGPEDSATDGLAQDLRGGMREDADCPDCRGGQLRAREGGSCSQGAGYVPLRRIPFNVM